MIFVRFSRNLYVILLLFFCNFSSLSSSYDRINYVEINVTSVKNKSPLPTQKSSESRAQAVTLITTEVVCGFCAGDHEAFKKIYLHYKRPIEQFLSKLLGSSEDAYEVTQGVFVSLWEKRTQVDPQKSIKGYLYTISKNAALKYLRLKNRVDHYPSGYEETFADNSGPAEHMYAKDTALLLEIAVNNMPAMRRKVFELSQEGLTTDQIAEKLELNRENVKRHITRARKDIRDLLFLIVLFAAVN